MMGFDEDHTAAPGKPADEQSAEGAHVAERHLTELLIVDDEEALRRWAERVLRDGGYVCGGAADAVEARACLERSAYSLVLLDVNMPGESGMELLSHIRSCYPATAVVMVTGADDPQLAMTAIEQGAYGYMVKPVRSGELLINVANALHRRRGEEESQRVMQSLKDAVNDRSYKLEDALQGLRRSEDQVWVSQAETILRLARLVEFRDEETGHHLQRMSSYCEILTRQLGLPERDRELVTASVAQLLVHGFMRHPPSEALAWCSTAEALASIW